MSETVSRMPTTRGRGRPRDPEVDRLIVGAALEELAERGLAGYSFQRVAQRAGVSRASVHLRWESPRALVLDALAQVTIVNLVEDSGTLRGDLIQLVSGICDQLTAPMLALQLRVILEAGDDGRAEFTEGLVRHGIAAVARVFEMARARGELLSSAQPRLVASALIGTIFIETISSASLEPPGPARQRDIVDMFAVGSLEISKSFS